MTLPDIDHTDPNVRVGITTAKIGTKTFPDDSKFVDWTRSAPNIQLVNGIENGKEPNLILCGVLEAIACLCVSEDRKQVVAVGLHLIGPDGCPVITIAENRAVKEGMLDHITKLFVLLGKMAYDGTTPAVIEPYRTDLIKSVYCYSIVKNLRRYNKWIPRLELFVKALELMNHKCGKLRGIVNSFKLTHEALQLIQEPNASYSDWGDLIQRMDKMMKDTEEVMKDCIQWAKDIPPKYWVKAIQTLNPVAVEAESEDFTEWLEELKIEDSDPFPVGRALGKLTTQHRYMHNLFNAAAKPTLGPLFQQQPVVVRGVPATPNVPITLPRNRLELKSLVTVMYRAVRQKIPQSVIDEVVDELLPLIAYSKSPNPCYGVVHCECALVAYFHQLPGPALAFNYLGVSKLSCGACNSWIMAYNKTLGEAGLRYYTAGTHGKWYFPWAIPPALATESLKKEMSKVVGTQLERYCNPGAKDKKRLDLSGSTHAKNFI